ncbi:PAS domain S-box protein [Deinococcus navajonensis]|uniref:histidine kinase n=1 Tax=Deinococcus navajonensis TaxID=309884 RepID=A0ABV8XN85_9DEIO
MNLPAGHTLTPGVSALETLPDPTLSTDQTGRGIDCNRAWQAMTGQRTPNLLAVLHPDDAAHAQAQWANDRAHWRPSTLTLRLRRADGSFGDYRADHDPHAGSEARPAAWLLSFTDVQHVPPAVARLAWEQSPDCLKTLSLDGRLLAMNPGGLRVMEVPDFAVCAGASWAAFWENETRPLVEAAVAAACRGEAGHFEGFCRTFAGTPKWWNVTVRGVRNGQGRISHLLAASRDVTERVRGERLAQGQADLLEAMTRGEPVGEVLTRTAQLVESLLGEVRCAVMMLDSEFGVLRVQAAPSLDPGFRSALAAVPLGHAGGACGMAAHTRTSLAVRDYHTDPRWPDLRAFADAFGVRACWSTPLLDESGEVHGTLALYFATPTQVTAAQEEIACAGGRLATFALQQDRRREALRRSEQRYRTLFEALPNIVWTSRQGGQSNQFNAHWQAFTGLPTHTQGLGWAEAIHPEDRQTAVQARQRGLETGTPYTADIRFRRKDGTYRWHAARVAPLPADQATDEYQWLGYAVDIHDRVEAEASLRASAAHFRRLADVNPIGVALGHPDGRVSYANDAYLRLIGASRADLEAGQVNWQALTPPEWRLQDERALAQAQARGHSDPYEKEYLLAGGRRLPVLLAVAQFGHGSDAQVVRYVLDLTDRKALEHTLSAENTALKALNAQILASAAEGIFGFDQNGHTTFANPAALTMTGFTLDELLGQPQHALLHHTRADGTANALLECPICQVTRDGQDSRATNAVFWRRDGTAFPVEYSATPLVDGAGAQVGGVVTFRDITERRQTEHALRSANEELRRSNHDLERFAFVASHDLQEPLRTVASFTELLVRRSGRTDPQTAKYADFVVGGVQRMKATIEDLLVFSRVRAESQQWVPVDTAAVLVQTVADLQASLDACGARVTWDPLPVTSGDATQLAQVFTHLLGNAVKFRRLEVAPLVHVTAGREGQVWHFEVRDNGLGIEKPYAERVFEMFQRLHTREAYPGTGMGLAIVRRIVERHGGRAWVTSTPGVGSTFHFTLSSTRVPPSGDEEPAG